jgi:hypothetical protein
VLFLPLERLSQAPSAAELHRSTASFDMRKHSRTFLISLLLLFIFGGQSSFAQNRRKRDLTKYDNGGTFDFRWSVVWDAHERMASTIRDFVWEHWTNKRLGYISRTVYTIEGDPTTYRLFIEPGANQTWHVVLTYRSNCCWFNGLHNPKHKRRIETGVVRYDIVDRVPTPDTSREPNMYMLRLRRTGDRNDADAFVL